MEHWPALARWQSLAYLHQVAGARTIPVEVGRHYLADGWGQRLMLLSDFIDCHISQPNGMLLQTGRAEPSSKSNQISSRRFAKCRFAVTAWFTVVICWGT